MANILSNDINDRLKNNLKLKKSFDTNESPLMKPNQPKNGFYLSRPPINTKNSLMNNNNSTIQKNHPSSISITNKNDNQNDMYDIGQNQILQKHKCIENYLNTTLRNEGTYMLSNSLQQQQSQQRSPPKSPISPTKLFFENTCDKVVCIEHENIYIRRVRPREIPGICEWRNSEVRFHMSPYYLKMLYHLYPEGWILAENHGCFLGLIFGMILDDKTAFGGLFSVRPCFRNQGIGAELWKAREEFCGPRNMGINSGVDRIASNLKKGMILSFGICKYVTQLSMSKIEQICATLDNFTFSPQTQTLNNGKNDENNNVICGYSSFPNNINKIAKSNQNLCPEDYEILCLNNLYNNNSDEFDQYIKDITEYDETIHGTNRHNFLSTLMKEPFAQNFQTNHSFLPCFDKRNFYLQTWFVRPRRKNNDNTQQISNNENISKTRSKILGYGIVRSLTDGYSIAPLYAENERIARDIIVKGLKHLAQTKLKPTSSNTSLPNSSPEDNLDQEKYINTPGPTQYNGENPECSKTFPFYIIVPFPELTYDPNDFCWDNNHRYLPQFQAKVLTKILRADICSKDALLKTLILALEPSFECIVYRMWSKYPKDLKRFPSVYAMFSLESFII